MMKKLAAFLLTAALACAIFAGGVLTVAAAEADAADDNVNTALFLKETESNSNVTSYVWLEKGTDSYRIVYEFDEPTRLAAQAGDITATQGQLVSVNGTNLTEIDGATLAVEAIPVALDTLDEGEGDGTPEEPAAPAEYRLVATVPMSAIRGDGTDKVILSAGFKGVGKYVSTVRYMHKFGAVGDNTSLRGTRIYRSDNPDDYESVTVTSVGTPGSANRGTAFNIYLSDTITSKKMEDMQFDMQKLKQFKGDNGDQKCYSDAEIDLLNRYEIVDYHNENSLIYNLQFGCEQYNGLRMHPANRSGEADSYASFMAPQTTVDGIDIYNLLQIQESVADNSCRYYNTNGQGVVNVGQQHLALQIHMEGNSIQVLFKGDSERDRLIQEGTVIYGTKYDGSLVATEATSFNENIAPDRTKKMVVGLKAGFLFPNGKMLKEDVFFVYNPVQKAWTRMGDTSVEPTEDTTLTNQEGYTAEEWALMHPASTEPAGKSGCGSVLSSDGGKLTLIVSFLTVLCAGALVSVRGKSRSK